eukprot:CAMPEP_0177681020 /NCGR_PEP_ID=MMETSP0447-20121125/30486_1 /TAXON_ID=0 /ORGANISM="Stygamoeba regulata, Strain BSH-02190019" /LENGTH=298 /DNA_ID=CAMNT_0019190395 /DNA_START=42 /DNA_END=940 /DNA_ORIENTATION=-
MGDTGTATAAAATSTFAHDIQPNHTIYVRNLKEKLKVDELKKALYALFSQFGPILEVVALKTFKMRGQAFVVFKDIGSATKALRDLQGFMFFGRPLIINYAKSKSDAILKLEGTYEELRNQRIAKRRQEQESQLWALLGEVLHKETIAGRDLSTSTTGTTTVADAATSWSIRCFFLSFGAASVPSAEGTDAAPKLKKKQRMDQEVAASATVVVPVVEVEQVPPSNRLFVQNLPEECPELALSVLFQRFPGYKEVRMVPGKKGIAFVEFSTDVEAGVAMTGLQLFKITPEHMMQISYAK